MKKQNIIIKLKNLSKNSGIYKMLDKSGNVLYIGKAPKRNNGKGLGNRVNEYYRTEYGARNPHAGGHWIKSLAKLENLFVYYCYFLIRITSYLDHCSNASGIYRH